MPMDDATGWNFAESLPDIIAESEPSHKREFETFYAHHAGFCPRQLYLSTLGLRDDTDTKGRLRAGHLIHEDVEASVTETRPSLETAPRVAYEAGPVRFVGRPTAFDPTDRIVWHVKPRAGWYKFHPPNDRHTDQLHVYMRGLGADSGQLVYISMTDLFDVRPWPPNGPMAFDEDRFESVVSRAETVRNQIIQRGIATREAAVPFDRCGCFLCETESVSFPTMPNDPAPHATHPNPDPPEPTDAPALLDAAPLDLPDREPAVLESSGGHVPQTLRELDIWVVWDGEEKIPKAPWQAGTMYPCRWAADGDRDPRASFERAAMVAELPIDDIHQAWPFPDGDRPDQIRPAVLLPHDPDAANIVFVDLDDVRDPESGTVTGEAIALIDQLGGYTELSITGSGIHIYGRGTLPDGVSTVSAPLSQSGRIEAYDHSRFTAGTWHHVDGTPRDTLPEVDGRFASIVGRYRRTATEP